ncbi:hypothetical protein JCM12298_02240 [Desulfothermus naphthae]
MQYVALEKRVDRLEEALMELVYQSRKTEMEIEKLSKEMKEFKNEMREFKDEMKEFKNEMREFKDEMKEFKNEMREFKDEMREFKNESERIHKEMNKRWGELANKLGTLAEDIVAPGIPQLIKRTYNFDVTEISVRRKRKLNGKIREYDVICVADNYLFLVDVKSTYRRHHFEEFESAISDFLTFFPEYRNLKVIPVVASLNLTEEIVNIATSKNWLALQLLGDYLDFVNKDKVRF